MKDWKRIFYLICFAGVMVIDWTRGGFTWECWAASTNLVAVILSALVAVNLSWKQEKAWPYVAWFGLWLAGAVTGFIFWKNHPATVFRGQFLTAAAGILCMGVVALRLVRQWLSRRKDCENTHTPTALIKGISVPAVFLIVMSLLMVLSPLGEIWPMYYLVAFALLYLAETSGEEKKKIALGISEGTILGFLIIQIWAFGFRPYDVVRYSGAYNNCNINALCYVVTYICVLYRLHLLWQQMQRAKETEAEPDTIQRRKCGARAIQWGIILCACLAAALVGFVLLTMTRTALLAVIGLTLVFGVLELFVYRKVCLWAVFRYVIGYLLCVVLLFPCVYGAVRYLPTILHHPVWWAGEYSEEKVHSFDPWNSEKYVSFDEVMDVLLSRVGLGEDDLLKEGAHTDAEFSKGATILYTEKDGELLTGEAAKSSMRVRLAIYKKYLQNLNFTGHELEEGYIPITPTYHAWHAQNVFIQVLFYYGIPAGVLFVILMVMAGCRAVKLAFKNREEGILLLLVWLLFVGYGMMECVWYPGQSILFYIYFVFSLSAPRHKKVEDGKQL